MKRALCLLYFSLCCTLAFPQGGPVPQYAAFTWTNAPDAAGNLLQSGYITFTPVTSSGAPIAPNMTSGGRVIPLPVTFKIVAGVAQPSYGTMQLVDVTQANPSNFCYKDTIHDNISGLSWSPDSCVQPAWNASWCTYATNGTTSSTTCDFGKYVPTGTPGALQVAGPPGVNWRGAWSSAATYAVGDGVSYGGSSYVSTIAGNTGTPGSSGWSLLAQAGANGTNCSSGSSPGTCNFNGTLQASAVAAPQVNNFLYANQYALAGDGTPSNPYTSLSGTGGIQEAINALPVTTGNASSRTVYIPSGYYLITNTITITNPVNLVGAGWDSVLYVSSSLNSSTDVIHVVPASGGEIKALRLFDFAIEPQSGTPGRYGINLDGTNGEILWGWIAHIEVLQLGSSAIYASGSGSGQGTPVLTRIEESSLDGGISCTSCGDSVTIGHNQLTGTGGNNFDMINGATGFIFEENNVTIAGGTHFGGSVQVTAPKILNNEFETLAGFTGSNGSVLDLDGPVVGGTITGNTFAVVNSITANGLRLNNATGVSVSANHFERGAGSSYDIIATSASANNTIGSNYWFSGQPFSSMFNNSGNGNYWVFGFGGNGLVLANGVPIRGITPSGTMENLELLDSSGIVWHYGYGGTAQIQSLSGPTYWGENPNNGQYAAGSGPLNYATGQTPTLIAGANSYWGVYNLVLTNMLFSRGAPTISSGFGTGAFVQQNNGTAEFEINVGTGGTASSGVIGLPQAANAWHCTCEDPTTISSTVWQTRQTSSTTTSCTVTNYTTSAAVAAWGSGDNLVCRATGR